MLSKIMLAGLAFMFAVPTMAAPTLGNDPSVAYGLNSFRRAFVPLTQAAAQISPLVRAHRYDEAITLAKTLDVRTMAFRLQGLGHLYQDANPKLFKDIRETAKDLEDALGAYDLAFDLLKAAKAQKNPIILANATANEQAAKEKLSGFLVRNPLVGNQTALRGYISAVEDFRWAKPKDDREYVLKQLVRMIDDLNSDVKHEKFTRDDIEEGLHELRRRIRWFLIEGLSMDGLVSDQSNPPNLLPGWQRFIVNPPGKYITYSTPYATDPIIVPKVIFAALSKLVTDIGAVKDQAEIQAGLGLPGARVDHKRFAAQMQAAMNRDEILEKLEKILRDQRR